MTALFGIVTGIALVGLTVNLIGMPSFSNQAVAMIGIGVGIDYALFIVTCYPESLHAGMGPEDATVRSIDTAGRAVLFAGTREEYDRTGDNAVAVANGLAATARVITAAAAIMFCVFGAFVLGSDRSLKLFGLGLSVAVLLDATVVRLVLVPATMELLGDRNWWLPRRLDRILPVVHVEAGEEGVPAPARKPETVG